MNPYYAALVGGLLIGLSSSILLLFKGRVFGISGIIGGVITPMHGEIMWRLTVLAGLISGGLFMNFFYPEFFPNSDLSQSKLIIAGLLVGFGTQLGSGCTSGHGVCGISRFSLRSIIATITFIITGALTVFITGGA